MPPCRELLLDEPEPELLPPRLEAPDEFEILAARSFDMPLSFRASYCLSFLTFALLPGMTLLLRDLLDEVARLLVGRVPRDVGLRDDAREASVRLDDQ